VPSIGTSPLATTTVYSAKMMRYCSVRILRFRAEGRGLLGFTFARRPVRHSKTRHHFQDVKHMDYRKSFCATASVQEPCGLACVEDGLWHTVTVKVQCFMRLECAAPGISASRPFHPACLGRSTLGPAEKVRSITANEMILSALQSNIGLTFVSLFFKYIATGQPRLSVTADTHALRTQQSGVTTSSKLVHWMRKATTLDPLLVSALHETQYLRRYGGQKDRAHASQFHMLRLSAKLSFAP